MPLKPAFVNAVFPNFVGETINKRSSCFIDLNTNRTGGCSNGNSGRFGFWSGDNGNDWIDYCRTIASILVTCARVYVRGWLADWTFS